MGAVADRLLLGRMRKAGIEYPELTLQAARASGLSIAVACALLDQETGGGRNVFGHDPTIFTGAGEVTKEKYLAYKAQRLKSGNKQMQGVGPMQLTWYSIQDEADGEGGCWRPGVNMRVGFRHAAALIRRSGLRLGVRAYNGSGPAAERYADHVLARVKVWEKRLGRPVVPKPPLRKLVYGDTDCEPELLKKLTACAKAYGGGARIYVRCGTRTRTEQELLYRLYKAGKGPLAAKPGTSNHEAHPPSRVGRAADCQLVRKDGSMVNIGDAPRMRDLMRDNGLCLPVIGEKWHVERGKTWRA